MLKNVYLLKKTNIQVHQRKWYIRHFSILERYIKARPNSNELKICEDVNKEKNEENKKNNSKYYPPNITRGVIPKSAYMNTWKIPEQPKNPKFLKIALIGAPNAGKSSLLNSILNKTISAVSPKINTTKQDIKGIYTKDNVQLIFIDAPGVVPSHKKKAFCKNLVSYAWKGYEEADLVLFIVDTVKRVSPDVFNIVRILAPKEIDPYISDSEDECNDHSAEVDDAKIEDTHEEFNNDKESSYKNYSEEKENMTESIISHNHNYENRSPKEKDDMKKSEEKFIKYFSGEMENELRYNDKSIKKDLFQNRKKIMESYYSSNNNNKKNEEKIVPPVILVLNKVDLCTHNKWANARAKEFMSNGDFDNIFFISAKYNRGIEELLDYIIKYKVKDQIWPYPKDTSTTLTKIQVVEQLVNTYLYCWFNKDVPYKIKHQILSWCVNLNNCLIIEYQIIVNTQKIAKMICGVHNKLIINMRKNVSYKLTKLWGQNVYVHIHVKSIDV